MKSHRPSARLLKNIAEISLAAAMIAFTFSRGLLLTFVYVAIFAWLLANWLEKRPIIPKTSLNPYLAAVALTLIVSIIFGSDWHQGIRGLNKWLRGILVFWLAYDLVGSEKRERKMVLAVVFALTLASLDGIFQYFTHRDFIRGYPIGYANYLIRTTSSFGYFGMFASYLLMATPVALLYALRQKQKSVQIILMILFLILALVNLYLTRSRGAWLSLSFTLILLLVGLKQWKWCAGLIAAYGLLFLILPNDLIFHYRKTTGIDKTIGHRIVLWQEATEVLKHHPLTGCGLNTYVQNVELYSPYKQKDVQRYYAHNGYLQHAAETGMLGILALFLLIAHYARQMWFLFSSRIPWQAKQDGVAVAVSVSNFLFYSFFDTIFHNLQPFLFFWFLLGWSFGNLDRFRQYENVKA